MRTLLGLIAMAIVAMVGFAADDAKTDSPRSAEKKPADPVGRPAYEFTLDALNGGQVKLAEMKGKVVLIDFFETWCPGCNAMMPGVVALHAKYKGDGLVVLGIDREKRGDKPEVIKKFIAKHKIDFPVMMLTDGTKEIIWNKYDVTHGIPYFVVIDRKGVVRHKQAGGNVGVLEATVRKLLNEKAVARVAQ